MSTPREFYARLIRTILPLHWISWEVSAVPLRAIGDATSDSKRSHLLKSWMQSTLSQLPNVKLVGSVLCAIIVGSFTWSSLEQLRPVPLAILRSLWLSSLTLSMGSVALAIHQAVFLSRVSCVPNHHKVLLEILCFKTPTGGMKPRQTLVFVWLLPVALLEWSIGLWLGGFTVMLWDITKMGRKVQGSLDVGVALVTGLALCVVLTTYVVSLHVLWLGTLRARHKMGIK